MTRPLVVAETFYSVQGEGPTAGTPSVFLRLGGCNLFCNFRDSQGQGNPCDTIPVWTRGRAMQNDDLLRAWQREGYLAAFARAAHLVITGGEPLLQQPALLLFLEALSRSFGRLPYVEVETNGTVLLEDGLGSKISQINCSPKLSSSGMELQRRYKPVVLQQFTQRYKEKAFFKFVITEPHDLYEIQECYMKPFAGLSPERVYLMPEGVTREGLIQKQAWVIALCKEYGFRYSGRLHVEVYNQVVGV